MLVTPNRNLPHPHVMLRLVPMAATFVPLPGPFSSLQGAFQPKTCPPQTSNVLDMAPGHRTGSHKQLQKDPKRPGRWDTMHVRIAWQIHHHKLRVKQKMEVDAHANNFVIKPEFLTQPPGPDLIQAIHHQRDLIQSSTPLSNPESHSRHPSFGGLGTLSVTAFGGLANLALNYPMIYHKDNRNAPSGEVGGTPEWWSRQQKTPQSSECQLECSTEPEQPGRDSTKEPQDRDTLREREWGQQLHLPKEKMEEEKQYIVEKQQGHSVAGTHDSSPAEDKSVPQTMTLEHGQQSNGCHSWESGDRKRRLECENYIKAKKMKRQREDDQEYFNEGPQPKDPTEKPSLTPTTLTPSSMSMQHMTIGNIIPGLYPVNSVCNLARTQDGIPVMQLIPYPALPWDIYRGMDLPVSSCQELVMRADPLHGVVGARLLEAADCSYRDPHHGFPHPPYHPSLALKQQERAYLMERERLHMLREEYYQHSLHSATMGGHLPHVSRLTSTYSGSHISRVGLTHSHQSSFPNRTLPPGCLSTLPPLVPLSGDPHRTTS
ncbi:autism susceptibility gene 2 protein homolog isoform X1 [Coregonus clupeaformis]|uniref:autism susceptibility gene 2 protein homolog isoform X1 n=1 Tax=Coregonus clupeaformis TaxID=59861 RepID=UPI001E1C3270|nr:autism susceptibility gene 2 protein homolog isoform X1 [Coregonus clupeaformis]